MKKVLITRESWKAIKIIKLIAEQGNIPYLLPLINTELVEFKLEITTFDYIVFTSPSSVVAFADYFKQIRFNNIVAVGKATERQIKKYTNRYANIMPKDANVNALIREFHLKKITNHRFLVPGAETREGELIKYLEDNGAYVEAPTTYRTNEETYPTDFVNYFIEKNIIDTITFCSPSAFKSYIKQANPYAHINYVAIGDTTANAMKEELPQIKVKYPESPGIEEMVKLI